MTCSMLLVSGAALLSVMALSGPAAAADCFVDSVAGLDTNNGTTDATPVKSPASIPTTCTVVKFKRGSEFKLDKGVKNLGLPTQMTYATIKTLTNYGDASLPLPKFVKDHVDGSGGLLQIFGAVTIDGLYLAGSKSGNAMSALGDGIGVMLFAGSKLVNSEITLCDIGVMTSGDNIQVLNNYIHDLAISVDAPHGVDPNQVGGAEGIFVNSSHVEVAYNRFINCTSQAEWVTITPDKPRCDGGATEVTVPLDKSGGGGEVTDVKIHHNFSYNSCGFFEVSTMPQTGATYVKGKFTNSIFYDNVMVDSGWISLLQINNTKLSNVTWANNTIIHHFLPTVKDASGKSVDMNDFGSSYIQAIPFNSMSSGVTGGGELSKGDIFWKNNLWYFDQKIIDQFKGALSPIDATHASTDEFLKNITVTGDKFLSKDPGFIDITSTTDPGAYDLLKTATEVIDQGTDVAEVTTDFLDRAAPVGKQDIGAFEYHADATPGAGGAKNPGDPGTTGKAGGGSPTVAAGGASATLVTGGRSSAVAGSSASVGGKAGSTTAGSTSPGSSSSSSTSSAGQGTTTGVAATGGGTQDSGAASGASDSGGCNCRMAQRSPSEYAGAALLALGAVLLRRSSRRASRRQV